MMVTESKIALYGAFFTTTTTTTAKPEAAKGSTGSLPIIPVAAGAGGGLLILIIIIVVVSRRRNKPQKNNNDKRAVVAFENPMYEQGRNIGGQPIYDNKDHEGLYDEPAFIKGGAGKENPMYNSNEDLTRDDTGYNAVIGALKQDNPVYDNDGAGDDYLTSGFEIQSQPIYGDDYLQSGESQGFGLAHVEPDDNAGDAGYLDVHPDEN
jgi:hypothetical protein